MRAGFESASSTEPGSSSDACALRLVGSGTEPERQRLQMVADAILAQTDALALGLIDGRYPSVDAAAEVLMSLAAALLLSNAPVEARGSAHERRTALRRERGE